VVITATIEQITNSPTEPVYIAPGCDFDLKYFIAMATPLGLATIYVRGTVLIHSGKLKEET